MIVELWQVSAVHPETGETRTFRVIAVKTWGSGIHDPGAVVPPEWRPSGMRLERTLNEDSSCESFLAAEERPTA